MIVINQYLQEECDICAKEFSDPLSLARHMNRCHSNVENDPSAPKPVSVDFGKRSKKESDIITKNLYVTSKLLICVFR